MPQIQISNLSKTYKVCRKKPGFRFRRESRIVRAVNQVSFSADKGELIGLIGPNGAGKSTTIKILSGILVPDSGDVEILGRIPWLERNAHVSQIGVIFGQRTQLWWDVPIIDSFNLLRDIYDVPQSQYAQILEELVAILDIEPLLETPLRQLSLGQRMRSEIVGSLLHQPPILFLDEPTIGLDSTSKLQLRAYIKERNHTNGTTVILTTHDMDDIEAVCNRVLVIGGGKLLYDGNLAGLRNRYAPERRVHVTFEGPPPVFADRIIVRKQSDSSIELTFDPQVVSTPDLIAEINRRCLVTDLTVENPDIDEVISRMYDLERM